MAAQRRPASRQSIAHLPVIGADLEAENKENVATDVEQSDPSQSSSFTINVSQRKTRSKSLGPGGTDILGDGAKNRRKSAAALPKSILKPSIPLSPLREIPMRKQESPERKQGSPPKSPHRSRSPAAATAAAAVSRASKSPVKQITKSPQKYQIAASPSKDDKTSPYRSKGDKAGNAAVEEEDAKEQRRLQREAIEKQRAARRKSLANRRVSFAPEATLHTWDHVEDMQDSTTSSASTDPTRRASTLSNHSRSGDSASETGGKQTYSPVPEPLEEEDTGNSPAQQRRLHQKQRRRRSSGIPPMNFNNPDEALSSSPTATSLSTDHMNLENRDLFPSEPAVPDQRMNNYDDDSHEMETGIACETENLEQLMDQSNAAFFRVATEAEQEHNNTYSPSMDRKSSDLRQLQNAPIQQDENDDMSMDITRAVGGIVQSQQMKGGLNGQSNVLGTPRQKFKQRRRSSAEASNFGSDTMDFTTAIGGIQSKREIANDEDSHIDENEELSMEFTSVFGGIQSKLNRGATGSENILQPSGQQFIMEEQEQTLSDASDGGDMEMTIAGGGIISSPEAHGKSEVGTQVFNAPGDAFERTELQSNKDVGNGTSSPKRSTRGNSPLKSTQTSPYSALPVSSASTHPTAMLEEENMNSGRSTHVERGPSAEGIETPTKPMQSRTARPTTPGKTPPSNNVAMRHPSPRRLFRDEIKESKSSPLPNSPRNQSRDTPSKSSMRRFSGIGYDKEGLGSPKVAALLDRRTSIGDQADVFAPEKFTAREVRFQDPRHLQVEIMKERDEEIQRENGEFDRRESNGVTEDQDVTATLREAIGSMTPRKNKPKARKSLATGTAKGLLGKRPIELDEEDEESTPKTLRGREASPVKKIRLQAPPSALETTGRPVKPRHSLACVSGNERPLTPTKNHQSERQSVTTPSHKGHFKDAEALPDAQKPLPLLKEVEISNPAHLEKSLDDEKISLQDFLKLTNIRFMELNTTKRRYTVAPSTNNDQDNEFAGAGQHLSKMFENAVVAGACTLPMLEMYQHSCRELKKYISEGRKIVREIEADTFDENPALFSEYLSASPSDRSVMDNQFKNMKTHARLISKGMWYEWRMKLLEGLKGVLVSEAEGLEQDGRLFEGRGTTLANVLPQLLEERSQLKIECSALQERADALANCDQAELRNARQRILSVAERIRQRREQIEGKKLQSNELDQKIEDVTEAKTETIQAIRESQKVLEEYKGWSLGEVTRHRRNLEALQAKCGWVITAASSSRITMVYRDQLELSLDTACFLSTSLISSEEPKRAAPISLSYVGDKMESQPQPLTTEKQFFLQLLNNHLQSITQNATRVKNVLEFITMGWTQALAVAEEIRRLNLECIASCSIPEDGRLAVLSMVLLTDVKTKLHVAFDIGAVVKGNEVTIKLKLRVEVIYGEDYKVEKMKEFLRSKIGEPLNYSGNCSWSDAVRELRKKLLAQGKK